MTDKISEFRRINEPRVGRALEQLGHVEKSAASMRVPPEEVGMMLTPLSSTVARLRGKPALSAPNPDDTLTPAGEQVASEMAAKVNATPPVAREMAALSGLTTQQLVDRMIACGAELAARRS